MKISVQNTILLDQVDTLVSELGAELFVKKQSVINDSTIGQHTRHVLEFYICILEHLPHGKVCYDDRKRDTRLEQSISLCREIIADIKVQLKALKKDAELDLLASYSDTDQTKDIIQSSLKRELAYAMDHTIHHLAIMKVILALEGIEVDHAVGVAPSTLHFEKQKSVAA